MNAKFLAILSLSALLFSCSKEEPTPQVTATTGKIELKFDPYFNEAKLPMGSTVVTPLGDTITITKAAYYLSNIVLTKAD